MGYEKGVDKGQKRVARSTEGRAVRSQRWTAGCSDARCGSVSPF